MRDVPSRRAAHGGGVGAPELVSVVVVASIRGGLALAAMELQIVLGLAAFGVVMYLSWNLREFLAARADRRSPTGERGRS